MKNWIFCLFLILTTLLNSCVNKKKIVYLNNIQENDTLTTLLPKNLNSVIHPGMNLYITFYNPSKEVNDLLNSSVNTQSSNITSTNLFFTTFPVNDSGHVNLPVLGSVDINNLTISQAQQKISEQINLIFQETYVTVKLSSRTFTVLGEFRSPGTYTFDRNYLSIFQAIGMAQDLTEYGNRKHVKIIRQTPKGALIKYIDLTDPSFINSPFYFIQNDDLIYVEPLNAKTFQTRTFPIGSILSIVSSVLVIFSLIK